MSNADAEQNVRGEIELHGSSVGTLRLPITMGCPETCAVLKVRTHAGLAGFPQATVELRPTKENPELINLASEDRVTIKLWRNDEQPNTVFCGEVGDIQLSRDKDRGPRMIVNALSPFWRLGACVLEQETVKDCNSLRELFQRILDVCGIWGRAKCDDDVDDVAGIVLVKRFPALAVVKSILLNKELVYSCNVGDVLRLANRKTMLKRPTNLPTITDDDVESWSIQYRNPPGRKP